MKNLLEVLSDNLGKKYKTTADFRADAKNIDMKVLAETMYQYMDYQQAIDLVDMSKFKPTMIIKKDE
ncbi:MAG: hypothetical protein J6K45_04915 [Clostridia bacterium]|nr:hypothetical protein [Clostridia bacterium]